MADIAQMLEMVSPNWARTMMAGVCEGEDVSAVYVSQTKGRIVARVQGFAVAMGRLVGVNAIAPEDQLMGVTFYESTRFYLPIKEVIGVEWDQRVYFPGGEGLRFDEVTSVTVRLRFDWGPWGTELRLPADDMDYGGNDDVKQERAQAFAVAVAQQLGG